MEILICFVFNVSLGNDSAAIWIGVEALNRRGAGVIDADYRGSVGVILFNHSDADFEVKVGDRVAQLIIEKIVTPEVEEVDDLDSTVRGSGGFGSTGV